MLILRENVDAWCSGGNATSLCRGNPGQLCYKKEYQGKLTSTFEPFLVFI